MQTAWSLGQNMFADHMKVDIIFQKDVARMVCGHGHGCDQSLDSHSYYPYLAEQLPVQLSEQHQELSQHRDGLGLVQSQWA